MNWLLSKLQADYPDWRYQPADRFAWSDEDQTIYYQPDIESATDFLLHETAHAILGHTSYRRDIELIKMERQAWSYAVSTLASKYQLTVDEDVIENSLDTYRDWLHARSLCPECSSTGYESAKQVYSCLACGSQWRVNQARDCALRRYRK